MIGEWLKQLWAEAAHGSLTQTPCEACGQPSQVHILATRRDGEMKELHVCHDHALDPGPLLDW